jgi:ASC-1-like (ASCH) protein
VSPKDCGFVSGEEGLSIMQEFYPLDKQQEIGVVGIKIKALD